MKIFRTMGVVLIGVLFFQNIAFAGDTTSPGDVTSLMGEAGDGHVNLSWAVATDDVGVAGYEVHYGFSSVTQPDQKYDYDIDAGALNAIQIVALSNGVTYYFSIKAYDEAGNKSVGWSNEISATPYEIEIPDTDVDYGQVQIQNYEVGANSVLMDVDNQNLSSDYTYYAACHVVEEGTYSKWFNRRFVYPQPSGSPDSVELLADGLKPETEYYCYAAIVNPNDDVILHSENIYVETNGEGVLAEDLFSDIDTLNKNKDAITFLYNTKIISGYDDGTFKPDNQINRAELVKVLVEATAMTPSHHVFHDCFTDVTDQWFAPYVCYAQWAGWINGYEDGSFKPAQTVNKAESLKMLFASQDIDVPTDISEKPFSDVSVSQWYAPYVYLAKQIGILEEKGDYFNPAGLRTRGEIAENIYSLLTTE